MAANHGEIWAKLDAGTEAYYQKVARTSIPFRRILDNITATARKYKVLVQTMFMRINGKKPSQHEIDAYIRRLEEIQSAGGIIRQVQLYTVARAPFESGATALSNDELDAVVEQVRNQTGLPVGGYYGRFGLG